MYRYTINMFCQQNPKTGFTKTLISELMMFLFSVPNELKTTAKAKLPQKTWQNQLYPDFGILTRIFTVGKFSSMRYEMRIS